MRTRIASTLLAAGAATLALGAGAARATGAAAPLLYHDIASSTSSNWGGYAVADAGTSATPASFTSVTGSWVQPAVTCTGPGSTYSSFWVGLGGFASSSQALEQTGTEADCSGGTARYSAWYEIVPAPSVKVDLAVDPGDSITATVAVSGTTVTMTLTNTTTGQTSTNTATVASPDTSSAEWIAEAPSSCNASGTSCRTLPLANFGTIAFTNASVTTADGTTGTIGGAGWGATAVTLRGSSVGSFPRSRFAVVQPSVVATPGALSADGSSFSITYQQPAVSIVSPRPGRGRGVHPWGWGF